MCFSFSGAPDLHRLHGLKRTSKANAVEGILANHIGPSQVPWQVYPNSWWQGFSIYSHRTVKIKELPCSYSMFAKSPSQKWTSHVPDNVKMYSACKVEDLTLENNEIITVNAKCRALSGSQSDSPKQLSFAWPWWTPLNIGKLNKILTLLCKVFIFLQMY